MVENIHEGFIPDYPVPPGWILEERLELRNWSQAEFARRCGRSAKLISDILAGKAPIEPETAIQFEKVLDLRASVWLGLEAKYQLFLAREREKDQLKQASKWYRRFPIAEMVKEKIIEAPKDEMEGANYLLVFFGVGGVSGWKAKMGETAAKARHTPKFKSSDEAVSVWLRLGELEAVKQNCKEYNAAKFKEALHKIRRLSVLSPKEFHPKMVQLCNDAGVAFVVVPPLSGNKLSGAAWWLQRKTPVIQLSLRGKYNDLFWFTFFHEAAHILLHSRKATFVDEGTVDGTDEENEANSWARDFLISPEDWKEFCFQGIFSKDSIVQFSLEQGIAPAIVLGRLQFEEKIKWGSPLNRSLKQRYEFS